MMIMASSTITSTSLDLMNSRNPSLQRQKSCGGYVGTKLPHRGHSSDSQASRVSMQHVVPSMAATPLVTQKPFGIISSMPPRKNGVNSGLTHQYSDSTTGGTRSDTNNTGFSHHQNGKRDTFKWSGVKVSFDADSVKIENEVNGAPPGIKAIGKERFGRGDLSVMETREVVLFTYESRERLLERLKIEAPVLPLLNGGVVSSPSESPGTEKKRKDDEREEDFAVLSEDSSC